MNSKPLNLSKAIFGIFFFLFSLNAFSQADFKVQHIQDDVARTGGTNSTFTAVSSLNNVIELANNNRKTHAGHSTLSNTNLNGDDLAGARQLTNTNTLTYYREGGSDNNNMRFNTSLWEYIGPAAGNNELIVRGRYTISLNGTTNSVTQALSGVTNANDCIPFITGIMNTTTNDDADSGTAIAYLENSTTLRVEKGSNGNNVTVYITVVEFTGSNWTVLHGDSGNVSADSGSFTLRDGSDGTGTATNVSAWGEAAIFSHFRADNNVNGIDDAIADVWPVVDPGATNQIVDWAFDGNHVSAQGTNRHFVHVLNNTNLSVTRFQNTSNVAGENTIDITSAGLTSITEALIVGSSRSSGGGTAYGRGWRNYYFNSTTEAAHWAHRSGNTMAHEIQIIDLSGLTTAISGPEINVVGNGTSITNGDITPTVGDDTDFGNVDITSGSAPHTFTIENLGTTDLTITSVTGGTSDFVITGTTSGTITAGNSISFIVTFDPSTIGTKTATISIANNDTTGGENPYTFDIEGVGTNSTFSQVIVSVDWPAYSAENRVEVYSPSGTLITTIDNGYTGSTNNSYGPITFNLGCLEDLNNYYFIMYDTANDGWDGVDNITITVGGTTVINQNGNAATSGGTTVYFNVSGASCTPLTEGPGGVVADLKLWLKSTAGLGYTDGQSVSLWSDQGRGSDATVNTTGQEPTYRDDAAYNVNFNPVVDFDNSYNPVPIDSDFSYDDITTQFLEGTSGLYTQDIFVVLIPDTTVDSTFGSMDIFCGDEDIATDQTDATGIGFGAYSIRFASEVISYAVGTTNEDGSGGTENGYGVAETGGGSYNNVGIINTRNNTGSTQQELYYNAVNIGDTQNDIADFSNVDDSRYWIGRSEGWEASTDARIAEIITYSSRKSDANLTDERNKIQSYLAIKYGITLGVNGTSQDYVDSDGTVIWDIDTGVAAEDVFNYNITGIGRDDASELNQKQSKTVNTTDDITIGHGVIATTNSLNGTNFTVNKSFLVWGNDDGTLAAQPAISVDMSSGIGGLTTTVDFTAIGRTWKVTKKGTVGVSKISIPETMLSATLTPPGDYLMFISDSPTFSPTSEYRILSLNGSNLETLYEFTGTKKYLTFGYAPERTFVRSIQFDGVQDYLDAGDVLDLEPTGFTISAWIKRNGVNASIVSKRDSGFTTGYNFGINASGQLEMSWNGGSETITSSVVIPTSIWHQVAVVFDGTTAKLYIDGVEDTIAALNVPTSNSESFLIAAADGNELNTTSFFNGNIDEVRVWDVALTENQLRFVINQEIVDNTNVDGSYFSGLGITPTKNDINTIPWANLKGYYPMSTYTFTNCKDASGNGNTAALKNLTTVDYQTAPLPYVSDADGAWDTAVTWLNNTVQDLPNSFSIIDGTTPINWNIVEINHNISIKTYTNLTREREVLALMVNSNKLTVNGDNAAGTGNGLTVTHYLNLDGKIDLEGESQLIQTIDSDIAVGVSGELERDQQGEGNIYRYNDWSSPVVSDFTAKTFTVADVLRDGTTSSTPVAITFVGGYDGAVGPPISIANYWIYAYRNLIHDSYSSWQQVGSTATLKAGEGYLMKGTGAATDQNYVFVGKPNNGDITLTINDGNDYLVGNPYPSALDADQFLTDNASTITGTIYFWEHYGGDSHNLKDYQAGFASYNFSGSVATPHPDVDQTVPSSPKMPERYIAVGQGFFVERDGQASSNLVFNNGQRAFQKEDVTNSIFMKTAKSKNTVLSTKNNTITDIRQKFRIGFEVEDKGHRQLLLTIDERATDAVDWGFDGEIYDLNEDDMFWTIDENKYVIQATNSISLEKEIPLGIQIKEECSILIKIDALENIAEGTSIYIKDKLTGDTHDITNQPFEINLEAGEYLERFVLAFQPRLKTLEEIALFEGIHIFMNNVSSELQVNRIVDTEIIDVVLFNYLGQKVRSWNANLNERFVSLPIQIITGAYIVKVSTSAGVITKKIIIE